MAPYKIKKEGYLLRSYFVDARRLMLFMVEQVFLLRGDGGWVMHDADIQCTVGLRGDRRSKGRGDFLF